MLVIHSLPQSFVPTCTRRPEGAAGNTRRAGRRIVKAEVNLPSFPSFSSPPSRHPVVHFLFRLLDEVILLVDIRSPMYFWRNLLWLSSLSCSSLTASILLKMVTRESCNVLACLRATSQPRCLSSWGSISTVVAEARQLTFAIPPSPLRRGLGCPRSFFSGSWPSRRLARLASQPARRPKNRVVRSWCRCSCGSEALAAPVLARGCRRTTRMPNPTSPDLMFCWRLPL